MVGDDCFAASSSFFFSMFFFFLRRSLFRGGEREHVRLATDLEAGRTGYCEGRLMLHTSISKRCDRTNLD